MHVANRTPMIAGMSLLTAAAAGALVVGPGLVSAPAPAVQAPVALAASPLNTFAGLITAGQQATAGVIGSAAQGNVIYPSDAIFIGGSLVTQVQGLITHPSTIPGAITHLPSQIEQLTGLVEQQSTGVVAGGLVANPTFPGGVGYTLPGQFVPFTSNPGAAGFPSPNTVTVNSFATGGLQAAASTLDGITPSPLPKLATPIVTGAQAVGTGLIQAGGLVRDASVTAVQGTFTAVASGNPVAVVHSVTNGIGGVTKSVIGDKSVPKVTPATGTGLGYVSPNPATNVVSPVKRLGAIGTVASTVGTAVKGVADAVTH